MSNGNGKKFTIGSKQINSPGTFRTDVPAINNIAISAFDEPKIETDYVTRAMNKEVSIKGHPGNIPETTFGSGRGIHWNPAAHGGRSQVFGPTESIPGSLPRFGGASSVSMDFSGGFKPDPMSGVRPEGGEKSFAGRSFAKSRDPGTFFTASQSRGGTAEEIFNIGTSTYSQRKESGGKGHEAYVMSGVSKINPMTQKSFLSPTTFSYGGTMKSFGSLNPKGGPTTRMQASIIKQAKKAAHTAKYGQAGITLGTTKPIKLGSGPAGAKSMLKMPVIGGPKVATTKPKYKKKKQESFSIVGNLLRRVADPFKKTGAGIITPPNRFKIL